MSAAERRSPVIRLRFVWIAIALAVFSSLLAAGWLIAPGLLLAAWGMTLEGPATAMLAQRTAVLYLGLAVMGLLASRQPTTGSRRAIAVGTAVICFGLAASGLFWYFTAMTGIGGLATAALELTIGVAYLVADRTDTVPAQRRIRMRSDGSRVRGKTG